jgi:hypothetical protein
VADSLATSASNFKVPLPPKLRYDVEVKYMPSILDNVKHWKVFEDDLEIKKFLEIIEEFSELHIDQDFISEERLDGGELLSKIAKHDIIQLPSNHIPRGLVPLKILFDGNDVAIKGRGSSDDADTTECNIGTPEEPKFCQSIKEFDQGAEG